MPCPLYHSGCAGIDINPDSQFPIPNSQFPIPDSQLAIPIDNCDTDRDRPCCSSQNSIFPSLECLYYPKLVRQG